MTVKGVLDGWAWMGFVKVNAVCCVGLEVTDSLAMS